MNRKYFGDSYDLVKRFFCFELSKLGYAVVIEPMLTEDWAGEEQSFYKLVGAAPLEQGVPPGRSALFVDPNTGVGKKPGGSHISPMELVNKTKSHEIVAAFDQSFSYRAKYPDCLIAKLSDFQQLGVPAMYYNSHAKFVLTAASEAPLRALRSHLLSVGMPGDRLVATFDHSTW